MANLNYLKKQEPNFWLGRLRKNKQIVKLCIAQRGVKVVPQRLRSLLLKGLSRVDGC
jgi:hypothetical protein